MPIGFYESAIFYSLTIYQFCLSHHFLYFDTYYRFSLESLSSIFITIFSYSLHPLSISQTAFSLSYLSLHLFTYHTSTFAFLAFLSTTSINSIFYLHISFLYSFSSTKTLSFSVPPSSSSFFTSPSLLMDPCSFLVSLTAIPYLYLFHIRYLQFLSQF